MKKTICINGNQFDFATHQRSVMSGSSVHSIIFDGYKQNDALYRAINDHEKGKTRIKLNGVVVARSAHVHLEINDDDNSVIEFIGR